MTITVTDPAALRWGFQLSARHAADNSQAGPLAPAPGEFMKLICPDSRPRGAGGCPAGAPIEYIEHSTPLVTNTFRIEWTPPASGRGPVKFYIAANAANGDGDNDGDNIYTANYALNPQAGLPASGPKLTPAGIVNAARLAAGM